MQKTVSECAEICHRWVQQIRAMQCERERHIKPSDHDTINELAQSTTPKDRSCSSQMSDVWNMEKLQQTTDCAILPILRAALLSASVRSKPVAVEVGHRGPLSLLLVPGAQRREGGRDVDRNLELTCDIGVEHTGCPWIGIGHRCSPWHRCRAYRYRCLAGCPWINPHEAEGAWGGGAFRILVAISIEAASATVSAALWNAGPRLIVQHPCKWCSLNPEEDRQRCRQESVETMCIYCQSRFM